MNIVRQGDVLLAKIEKLPKDAIEIKTEESRVVLAYGEVTGHAHAFYDVSKVKLWSAGAERFLQVVSKSDNQVEAWKVKNVASKQIAYFAEYTDPLQIIEMGWTPLSLEMVDGAIVKHEEHFHPVIFPGIYKLPTQMEYEPKALRRVAD